MLIGDKKHYADARVLDRVVYISRKQEDATDLVGNAIIVADTMAYNPASKTAPDTAKRWAEYYDRGKTFQPEPAEVPNRWFPVTIIDIDIRAEGGRAYKVVDDQNHRFDLREDQVLEAITSCGIQAGGRILGKFTWGILGSQMRLVLVGGKLHTEMTKRADELQKAVERKAAGLAPNTAKLQVGHIYEKRDKSIHAFVGRVRMPGNDKALYAFLELPQKPDKVEVNSEDDLGRDWIQQIIRTNGVSDAWDTMSWVERCEWQWRDQYHWRRTSERGTIVFMTSPKFEFEVGADAGEVVRTVRDNVNCCHTYQNGSGNDLSEIHALGPTPRREYYEARGFDWYRLTPAERERRQEEFEKNVQRDIVAARIKFRDALVWT